MVKESLYVVFAKCLVPHQCGYSVYTKITPELKIKEYTCKMNKLYIRKPSKEPILQKWWALIHWENKDKIYPIKSHELTFKVPSSPGFSFPHMSNTEKTNSLTVFQAIHHFALFSSNFHLAREYCPQNFSREKGKEEVEGKAKSNSHSAVSQPFESIIPL